MLKKMVRRVYVEKKKGFDTEASTLLQELREFVGQPLSGLRILDRYDVEGLDEQEFERAATAILSDPATDHVVFEQPKLETGEQMFASELVPGQYDQRADNAAQVLHMQTRAEMPLVRCAKVYILTGDVDLAAIKEYMINPVERQPAQEESYKTLARKSPKVEDIPVMDGFITMNKQQVEAFLEEQGYAMSLADMLLTQTYFAEEEQRDPTETELKVLDTYWSDHCRHTTFLTVLDKVSFASDEVSQRAAYAWADYMETRRSMESTKDVSLMDLATIYAKSAREQGKLDKLDVSEEINACSIKCRVETSKGPEDYLIMFKNETHNHPTEIEPFGGAATCLGGAIRDPLSGRSYVHQAMRITGSADPRESLKDTMEHKLPQRTITREAAKGYASYGNEIGLAAGLVDEIYHEGYKAKRMELGAVMAATPEANVVREVPRPGDVILLIGGRTGRDGVGGATGSSQVQDEGAMEDLSAEVQKGNPLEERKLQRLFRNPDFTRKVVRCNDFGAGGVSVAIGELADGVDIDLSKVPVKYEGLTGTEIAISESQERMAVVVRERHVDTVLELASKENVEATVVAQVTDKNRMRLFWRDEAIVDMNRDFINESGATQHANAKVKQFGVDKVFDEPVADSFEDTLLHLLGDLNICSQKGLVEMFGASAGANSITRPMGGKHLLTPVQGMSAKVPVLDAEAYTATLMSYGLDPYLMEKSPYMGAAYAVVDSVAKVVAMGGDMADCWLTFQEYFESLGDDPERWGKPLGALLGAYSAQKGLRIASIGGKDSMSGSYLDIDVPPTFCSFCVSPVAADAVITPEFKAAGNKLYLLDISRTDTGLPDYEDVRKKYRHLSELIADGQIASAWAVGRGGYLAGAAKCALGSGLGVKLTSKSKKNMTRKHYGSILLEAKELDSPYIKEVGFVLEEPIIACCGEQVALKDAETAYTQPLAEVFPERKAGGQTLKELPTVQAEYKPNRYPTALPRVAIPVLPGTSGEYELAKAFERAGSVPRIVVIKNGNASELSESVERLASEINSSQIMALPGGFTGGDDPDGAAKMTEIFLRDPMLVDAIQELLSERDGLMLGVGNGCQALVRLGLLPDGKIMQRSQNSPVFTQNTAGRFVSTVASLRTTNNQSPWLGGVSEGDVHLAVVDYANGRFVASDEQLKRLAENGQIAMQYANGEGIPTMDERYNPAGSAGAVEALLSPCRKILGKMTRPELTPAGTMQNVPGNYDFKLFEQGVAYFK